MAEFWSKIRNSLGQKVDLNQLERYATRESLAQAVVDALSDYSTNAEVQNTISTALEDYITAGDARDAIANAVAAASHVTLADVEALPPTGADHVLYLVPTEEETDRTRTVYCWLDGSWKLLSARCSNPNLLNNWYFPDPVNQRGQTVYTETGYTIDRWYCDCTVEYPAKITADGMALSGKVPIYQRFERNRLVPGRTYTISLLTADGMLVSYREKIPLSNGSITGVVDGFTLKFTRSNKYDELQLSYSGGIKEHVFIAAKLEAGPFQTLASKKGEHWILRDAPPEKALELAACQRYAVPAKAETRFAGSTMSSNRVRFFIPLPNTMRTNPAISNFIPQILYNGTLVGMSSPTFSTLLTPSGINVTMASPEFICSPKVPVIVYSATDFLISADL